MSEAAITLRQAISAMTEPMVWVATTMTNTRLTMAAVVSNARDSAGPGSQTTSAITAMASSGVQ